MISRRLTPVLISLFVLVYVFMVASYTHQHGNIDQQRKAERAEALAHGVTPSSQSSR